MKYYCQPDGGQWNVLVTVIQSDEIQGWSLICGTELMGTYTNDGGTGFLVVDMNYIYDTPQE